MIKRRKCCDCKRPINTPYRNRCKECYQKKLQKQTEKKRNRQISKMKTSVEYQITKVKEVADKRFWCTAHDGCFRASFSEQGKKVESLKHIRAKFDRWLLHRLEGHIVFCELRLKDVGRPDLVIIHKNTGEIWIEEIVCSEKKESLIKKNNKYPFPVKSIKV